MTKRENDTRNLSVALSIKRSIANILFFALLTILSVASFSSIRWISPAIHLNTQFGSGRDLTYACIIGLTILIISAISFWATNKNKISDFGILLKAGIGILISGIVIASIFASDKAVAFYSGSGFIIGILVMLSAFKLADSAWKINLAMIVLISLGTTFALKTWIRELYEINQTWQHYLQTREEFWAKQGKSLDSPEVKLFEARLKSRDNGGFLFHGNLGGAYLAVVFLVSLANVAKRIRDKIARKQFAGLWLISSILISGFIFSALVITMSKSAILACILALLIIGCIWILKSILIEHFRLAVVLTLIIIACISAIIIGYGLINHTLPTLSMAYRWQYWQASWKMFKEHYLTGVGPANFGYYYLRYKLPQAEEEVASPHNFIVQGFTELGIIGGTGLLLFIAAIFYQLGKDVCIKVKNNNHFIENNSLDISTDNSLSAASAMLILSLAVFGIIFVFNQSNLPGFIYLLAEWLPYILVFGLTFILCCFEGDKIEQIVNIPPSSTDKLFLCSALIAFVLSNLTNFSLFEPSTQILFFFVTGISLSAFIEFPRKHNRKSKQKYPKKSSHVREDKFYYKNGQKIFAILAAVIIITSYSYYQLRPAALAESAEAKAEQLPEISSPEYDIAYNIFVKLTEQYTYDAHMPAQAGKRELTIAQSSISPVNLIQEAINWYEIAYNRAPILWKILAQQAQCYLILAKLEPMNKLRYFEYAEHLLERARKIAPLSRTLAKDTGLTYYTHIRLLKRPSRKLLERATKNLKDAIKLNDALSDESLRRFSQADINKIKSALQYIRSLVNTPIQAKEKN